MDKIWTVEEYSYSAGVFNTYLFNDELRAVSFAAQLITKACIVQGMDDPRYRDRSQYLTMLDLIKFGTKESLNMAIAEYGIMLINLGHGNVTHVNVSMKPIWGIDTRTEPYKTFGPASKVEKPCKVCKRNVTEDEPLCWNCGTKDPGK